MKDPIFIIAEAGVNHNGDPKIAQELVRVAARAGADCVKFQTSKVGDLVSVHAPKAPYQLETTEKSESQLEMLKRLELKRSDHAMLVELCDAQGIQFLSTPFDLGSISFLQELGIKLWKVPSGEITNLPYLVKIAQTGMPVYLSTGMSTLGEVGDALDILRQNGSGPVTLLHCNTEYPTPMQDVNLSAMKTLGNTFGVPVGYSDHTLGIEVPVAAAALGAVVIEKHFTLDRSMEGPDHKASLEPDELAAMVRAVRNIEQAMGCGVKEPSASERKNIEIARKSIIAARNIVKGEALTAENLTVKRPGSGISPMRWHELVGTRAVRDFERDELIEE